jgi:competence protein ComEC
MLLGQKAVLSRAQQDGFMRSGTFHIFSISGLHVGVIAVALQSILRLLRAPRGIAVALSLAILWLYLEITGINSPSVRSFVMIAFLLTTRLSRLPGNALAALAAAALTTLLIDPLQLFSTGFQMSYTVVAALVLMGVPLTEKCLARWQPFVARPKPIWRWHHRRIEWCGRWLIGSCAAGWVAFLASIPSGIGYFQLLSPGSLIANLVIIPLSSLAIISGFLSLLTGLMGLLSLSALFNSAAAVIIIGMDWIIQRGTSLPGAYFDACFTRDWMAPTFLAIMTAVLFFGHAQGWSRRYGGFWAPVVILGLLLLAGVKFSQVGN